MYQVELSHKLVDIRFHGRAGQGVVTASRLLGEAAIADGKWTHAFPAFGPERMGAPVTSFTRIADEKFTIKTQVYHPDTIVMIDPSLIHDQQYYEGIKDGGKILLNTTEIEPELAQALQQYEVWIVDGDEISRKYLGRTIANTVMLGALIRVTEIVEKSSLIEALKRKFPGSLGEKNEQAINAAFEEVKPV